MDEEMVAMDRYGRISKLANFGCALALLSVIGVLLNPLGSESNEAQAAVSVDLGNTSTIAMSIFNSDGMELADNATQTVDAELGEVAYINNTVRLTANRLKQYYVDVQAVPGTNGNLVGVEHGDSIGGVGVAVLPANFRDNTWGVALSDNVVAADAALGYNTLPMADSTSRVQYQSGVNPANGTKDVKLTFAAKITDAKPADSYLANVMVSVVAEPEAVFGGITTMQEMTASACSDARENDTIRLRDTRDDKYYWIAKLKDGNCWMTQNLDLDLEGRTLTSNDSDTAVNWTSNTGASSLNFGTSYYNVKYFDPGVYVYTTPTAQAGCDTTTNLAECNGWRAVDLSATNYDAHYLVGNYYSWSAATAGSNSASRSICAKGWQLPVHTGAKSFGSLFATYGVKSDGTFYGGQDVRVAPIFMLYNGLVNATSSRINFPGIGGHYWTSISYAGNNAGYVWLGNDVTTDRYAVNYNGYGVRCVAK